MDKQTTREKLSQLNRALRQINVVLGMHRLAREGRIGDDVVSAEDLLDTLAPLGDAAGDEAAAVIDELLDAYHVERDPTVVPLFPEVRHGRA